MQARASRSPGMWPGWVGPAVVAALAFALALPGVANGYTLDDHQAILGHPAVTGEVGLLEVFSREYWGRPLGEQWSSSYRPLTTLSFTLEHWITTAPWLHHLGNAVAYAVLCGLVTLLARRWCPAGVALAVGVGFAVLPIHVESVASLVGRADVLAAIAGVLAVSLTLPRVDGSSRSARAWLGAGALYLAGLLCKESIALLPALAAWLVWIEVRGDRAALRRRGTWLPVVGLAVVGLAYLAARQRVLGVGLPGDFVPADNLLVERHGIARVWGNLAVAGHYLELSFVPLRLCADHTYADIVPPVSAWDGGAAWAWLGLGAAAIVGRDAVRAVRGRGRGLLVATALAYLLVGQWVIDLSVILAERLALWPTLWLAIAIGAAVEPMLVPERRRRLVVLVGILFGLAAVRTVGRTLDWHDGVTLQRSSLAACPRAVHGRFILANLLRERGDAAESVWHYAVAGAGRAAFPGPFDVPALDVEATMPLDDRLRRLPELVDASDPLRFWASLHGYLMSQGAYAEAEVVRRLAEGEGPR